MLTMNRCKLYIYQRYKVNTTKLAHITRIPSELVPSDGQTSSPVKDGIIFVNFKGLGIQSGGFQVVLLLIVFISEESELLCARCHCLEVSTPILDSVSYSLKSMSCVHKSPLAIPNTSRNFPKVSGFTYFRELLKSFMHSSGTSRRSHWE